MVASHFLPLVSGAVASLVEVRLEPSTAVGDHEGGGEVGVIPSTSSEVLPIVSHSVWAIIIPEVREQAPVLASVNKIHIRLMHQKSNEPPEPCSHYDFDLQFTLVSDVPHGSSWVAVYGVIAVARDPVYVAVHGQGVIGK